VHFPYERVIKEPRKPENRITFHILSKGVLKKDQNGFLYAESFELFDFYKCDYTCKKPKYVNYRKKSIFNFNIGFI